MHGFYFLVDIVSFFCSYKLRLQENMKKQSAQKIE